MKICLACNEKIDSPHWECSSCHYRPKKINNFLAFAPELAHNNEGYDASYFKDMFALEASHFWSRSRNRLMVWALQRYFSQAKNFFEIGCGTGFVLSGIKEARPKLKISGSELCSAALPYVARRLEEVNLFQMDARRIPFQEEFDVIGALDVLEHIEQDDIVLSSMYRAVRRGGGIIVAVPQHPFLWSQFDEHSHHVRRYSSNELKAKIKNAGFKIERITSFVSLLFPLVIASRMKLKKLDSKYDHIAAMKVSIWQNVFLEKILDFERVLISAGLSFPAGSSLLVIAQKT